MISQEEYSPEDPANPCVNYPTEEYESYADCDDHFVRSFLPPGLKPFWTVDNISEATNVFRLGHAFSNESSRYLGKISLQWTFNRPQWSLQPNWLIYFLGCKSQIASRPA